MNKKKTISYRFQFPDGVQKEFTLNLSYPELDFIPEAQTTPPPWAELGFHQCPACSLNAKASPYCPIAVNLAPAAESFNAIVSFAEVETMVLTEEREYRRQGPINEGLSSLIGVIMVTSGCPILDKLRPMAHTHLPFATMEETTYRAVSMYLLGQYFLRRRGANPDWDLTNLVGLYEEIRSVNKNFVQRLHAVKQKDANINALVNLDCFALKIVSAVEDQWWEDMENIFNPYFKS